MFAMKICVVVALLAPLAVPVQATHHEPCHQALRSRDGTWSKRSGCVDVNGTAVHIGKHEVPYEQGFESGIPYKFDGSCEKHVEGGFPQYIHYFKGTGNVQAKNTIIREGLDWSRYRWPARMCYFGYNQSLDERNCSTDFISKPSYTPSVYTGEQACAKYQPWPRWGWHFHSNCSDGCYNIHARASCDQYTKCPNATHMIKAGQSLYSANPDQYTVGRGGTGLRGSSIYCPQFLDSCDSARCCEAKATCDSFTSCSNLTHVNKGNTTRCTSDAASCDSATCCEATTTATTITATSTTITATSTTTTATTTIAPGATQDKPGSKPPGATQDKPGSKAPGATQDKPGSKPPGATQDKPGSKPPGATQDKPGSKPPVGKFGPVAPKAKKVPNVYTKAKSGFGPQTVKAPVSKSNTTKAPSTCGKQLDLKKDAEAVCSALGDVLEARAGCIEHTTEAKCTGGCTWNGDSVVLDNGIVFESATDGRCDAEMDSFLAKKEYAGKFTGCSLTAAKKLLGTVTSACNQTKAKAACNADTKNGCRWAISPFDKSERDKAERGIGVEHKCDFEPAAAFRANKGCNMADQKKAIKFMKAEDKSKVAGAKKYLEQYKQTVRDLKQFVEQYCGNNMTGSMNSTCTETKVNQLKAAEADVANFNTVSQGYELLAKSSAAIPDAGAAAACAM